MACSSLLDSQSSAGRPLLHPPQAELVSITRLTRPHVLAGARERLAPPLLPSRPRSWPARRRRLAPSTRLHVIVTVYSTLHPAQVSTPESPLCQQCKRPERFTFVAGLLGFHSRRLQSSQSPPVSQPTANRHFQLLSGNPDQSTHWATSVCASIETFVGTSEARL